MARYKHWLLITLSLIPLVQPKLRRTGLMKTNRRQCRAALAAVSIAISLLLVGCPPPEPPPPSGIDDPLVGEAKSRAGQPFAASNPIAIAELDPPDSGNLSDPGLVFEEYNTIKGEKFFDNGVFAVETRPRGNAFKQPLQIFNQNVVPEHEVVYDLSQYDYSSPTIQPPIGIVPVAGRYIAGFQVIHLVAGSNPPSFPIILVVNGDAFLRLTGEPPRTFGTSYRLATHNVGFALTNGDPLDEDFPRIVKATVKVLDNARIRLGFLIDSEAYTGALIGELTPGAASTIDVTATFFMRRDLNAATEGSTGFVGFSSLFFRGEADTPGDPTDEAHDADTLRVEFSDGSAVERALFNPTGPTPSVLDFPAPHGSSTTAFALDQRDRDASHYTTFASANYATRSSLRIKGINSSIPMSVRLHIFPTNSEFFDNVAVHLIVGKSLSKGERISVRYQLNAD